MSGLYVFGFTRVLAFAFARAKSFRMMLLLHRGRTLCAHGNYDPAAPGAPVSNPISVEREGSRNALNARPRLFVRLPPYNLVLIVSAENKWPNGSS